MNDQFTYTVTDGFGSNSTGLINVVLSTAPLFGQGTPPISTINGTAVLNFAGIPGYSYSVQRSTNVNFTTFDILWTTNAPSSGLFQFTDPNPPQPTAFYRLQYNDP